VFIGNDFEADIPKVTSLFGGQINKSIHPRKDFTTDWQFAAIAEDLKR
jgi:hypothetical protein